MKAFLQALAEQYGHQSTHLLAILRAIQAQYHHIPQPAIEELATLLALPRTQILAVIEFYSFLHLQPRGEYELLISDSITDHMLGKHELMAYFSQQLGVKVGTVRADGRVSLANTSCTGLCDQGPAGLVNGLPLPHLTPGKIDQIVALINQQTSVSDWPAELFAVKDTIHTTSLLLNQPITPGSAIQSVLTNGADALLNAIEQSGLRGRGGAGFSTAMKWRFCAQEPETTRYVVCNADEGEPGTFKDRVLLTQHATAVIEGMCVCAAIIGARQGFIYLRGEYQYLYTHLQTVLQQQRELGWLGKNCLGQGVDFDIEICLGAGAYICGEESALIESLEGKMGIPRNRPPYPVTHGYLGKPTVVNNVETFLAASAIAVRGGEWFANRGTLKSKGSKILSICGDVARPGIYEYPFGTTIQSIIDDCGAEDVLGVQIGGPSGTFISNIEFNRQLAFEDLATGGSFIVFNTTRNLLNVVKNFTHFFAHESCGFCTPCRVGTTLLAKQLDKITDGHGSAGDVAELEALCQLVKQYSHCGLGQTAANPILSTLERYPELYQAQLKKISYEPGFDLDAALETARRMTNRNDAGAHLAQVGEDHV